MRYSGEEIRMALEYGDSCDKATARDIQRRFKYYPQGDYYEYIENNNKNIEKSGKEEYEDFINGNKRKLTKKQFSKICNTYANFLVYKGKEAGETGDVIYYHSINTPHGVQSDAFKVFDKKDSETFTIYAKKCTMIIGRGRIVGKSLVMIDNKTGRWYEPGDEKYKSLPKALYDYLLRLG